MNISTCINNIKVALGYPVVNIEVTDEVIEEYISLAFNEVKPNLSTTSLMTLAYSDCIDLADKKVYSVVSVFRGEPNNSRSTASRRYSDDLLFNSSGKVINMGYTGILDGVIISTLQRQLVNTLKSTSDIDFTYRDKKLYLVSSNDQPEEVTLEYIPDYEDASAIEDPYWINIIFRMSLAYTKVALGRMRSKFRSSSVPYELDGETLLNEGNQELSELRNQLQENMDLLYPLD